MEKAILEINEQLQAAVEQLEITTRELQVQFHALKRKLSQLETETFHSIDCPKGAERAKQDAKEIALEAREINDRGW